jgi:predicted solute-binding protein
MGLENIDTVVNSAASRLALAQDTIRRYFNNFCFDLNSPQHAGLEAFFNDLHTTGIFPEAIPIRFFKGGPPLSS